MQFSPPFCDTGYPNPGQYYCYNPPYPQPTVYPEIIGDGEVVSVLFPDGSIHLYFIPLNKRFAPTYHNYPNPNYNPYFNNNMGAYYVRGISNPISSAVFNQKCQQMYAGRLTTPCFVSDCNMNLPSPGFQLKFHNDCSTSTTDLHYFFPRLRRHDWIPVVEPKRSASMQVDIPVKEIQLRNQEVVCDRACICSVSDDESQSENETIECYCDKVASSRKTNVTNKQVPKKRISLKREKQKLQIKKSNVEVECECNETSTTDKSVTTYAEQSSSCGENDRNTQTSQSVTTATSERAATGAYTSCTSDVETELWFPKMSADLLPSKSSENIIGVCETACSSGTCCCSIDSDARVRDAKR